LGAQAGWHFIDSKRRVTIGTVPQELRASYGGQSFLAFFEAAYSFSPSERVTLEPFASVGWHALRLDGFRESGGNAALAARGERWDSAYGSVGLRPSFKLGQEVFLNLEAGWRHAFGQVVPASQMRFAAGGAPFRVEGAAIDRDEAFFGAGLSIALNDRSRLRLEYNGSLGNRGQSHGGNLAFSFSW
jgi:outer membrane autotransporter protein